MVDMSKQMTRVDNTVANMDRKNKEILDVVDKVRFAKFVSI